MITMNFLSLSLSLLLFLWHVSVRLSCQFLMLVFRNQYTHSRFPLSPCLALSVSKYYKCRKIIVRANLWVCVFRFSETRNFSNGNMDTFLSHADEEEEADERARSEWEVKKHSRWSRQKIVRSFVRWFVCSFVRLFACLWFVCTRTRETKIWFFVFHFDFRLILLLLLWLNKLKCMRVEIRNFSFFDCSSALLPCSPFSVPTRSRLLSFIFSQNAA